MNMRPASNNKKRKVGKTLKKKKMENGKLGFFVVAETFAQ